MEEVVDSIESFGRSRNLQQKALVDSSPHSA